MKFSISKDSFLKGLQTVQSVISSHTTLPILYNVLICGSKKSLTLTATDLTVTMQYRIEADVQDAGESTFVARRLLNIIRELPEDKLSFETDDKETAAVQCGASFYKLFGVSSEEFPKPQESEAEKVFSLEQRVLKEMLKKTSYAACFDESRQVLNGILMSLKESKLSVVATDGRRLALVEQEVELPSDIQYNFIIPIKTVSELMRCLKDSGTVAIKPSKSMVVFDMDDIKLTTKLIDGSYPNYNQVIPGNCEERLVVDRELLLAAIRRVSLLTNDKYPSVKMSFENNSVVINAVTPDVGEASERLAVKYKGKSLKMSFNPEFLMDPLRNLVSDEMFIEFTDDISPIVIKCDIPFIYVLMPLRLG